MSDRLIESPFFFEHAYGHPRFVVFESLVIFAGKILSPVIGINTVVWGNLLRILTIAALYLEWLYVFRRWAGLSTGVSAALALAVNLWQEPFAATVSFALGFWFLPFVFFGIIAAVKGFLEPRPSRRWGWHIAASLAFAVHPIAFATGNFAIGLAWLNKLRRERSPKTFAALVAWALPALALGVFLFGSFLAAQGADAARISAETLVRNTKIASHLPITPLRSVRAIVLLALIVFCRRRAGEGRAGAAWDVLLAYQIASVIGQNANVITGTYFINDHFPFSERIVAVTAAALAWSSSQRPPSRIERAVGILLLLGIFVDVLGLLIGHSIRTWLVLGSEVPFLSGCLLMAWTILGRPRVPLPKAGTFAAMAALISISALYAFVFLWRLNRGFIPAHALAQDARPVIQELAKLPKGVVLADPWLSGIISAATDDRPYWSTYAFGDEASNQELVTRWRDALAFYPDDPSVSGPAARDSLFGAENHLCDSLAERLIYKPLLTRGVIAQSLCRQTLDEDSFASFLREERGKQLKIGSEWKPAYRLDLVVIDSAKGESLPKNVAASFKPLWNDARWSIYGFIDR